MKLYFRLLLFFIPVSVSIIVISGQTLPQSWAQSSVSGNPQIDNVSISTNSSDPQIAAIGNNVYVAWRDDTTGKGDIYFKASGNNGAEFNGTKRVGKTNETSSDPQIAASGNNVYVAWRDETTGNGDIYFKVSMDGGNSFEPTDKLARTAVVSSDPKISLSDNNVYILWRDDVAGKGVLNYRASDDGGISFTSPQKLSLDRMNSSQAQISSSGENVYVVWRDDTTGNGDIYFRTNTVADITNISNSTSGSSNPKIATSGNNVYIVWEEGNDLYLKSSGDNGINFSDAVELKTKKKNLSFTDPFIVSSFTG